MNTQSLALFHHDEHFCKVNKQWSATVLLAQPAMFFLKDVCPLLEITSKIVVAHVGSLSAQGQDPYAVMGVRKIWNHWYVRMLVFAPYYQAQLRTDIRMIKRGMDANTLLVQKGNFLLSQVCRCIPFSSSQLRHQARKLTTAECGIFKREETYLVRMEIFGPWISRLWQEGFVHPGVGCKQKRDDAATPKPAVPKSKKRRV
jgi:hypothetical protein